MKNLMGSICTLIVAAILLQGCSYSLQGFGWVAVALPLIGAIIYGYKTVKSKVYHPITNPDALYAYLLGAAAIAFYFAFQFEWL